MCGACGTGRVAAAPEEVLAGAGPARRAARAAAANRLLAGRQLRVSSWRGGYLLTAATGGARVASSLDQLWAAVGDPLPVVAPADGALRWAWAPLPRWWDPQAAAVWITAAMRSGAVTEAVLPAEPSGEQRGAEHAVHLSPGGPVVVPQPPPRGEIGILATNPWAAVEALLTFACGAPAGVVTARAAAPASAFPVPTAS